VDDCILRGFAVIADVAQYLQVLGLGFAMIESHPGGRVHPVVLVTLRFDAIELQVQ
jgi:hypothetical protein